MTLERDVLERVFLSLTELFHIKLNNKNPTNLEVRCGNSVLKKKLEYNLENNLFTRDTGKKKRKLEYHLVGVVFAVGTMIFQGIVVCIFEGNKHLQLTVHRKKEKYQEHVLDWPAILKS